MMSRHLETEQEEKVILLMSRHLETEQEEKMMNKTMDP